VVFAQQIIFSSATFAEVEFLVRNTFTVRDVTVAHPPTRNIPHSRIQAQQPCCIEPKSYRLDSPTRDEVFVTSQFLGSFFSFS
jgi:hypothetical protein